MHGIYNQTLMPSIDEEDDSVLDDSVVEPANNTKTKFESSSLHYSPEHTVKDSNSSKSTLAIFSRESSMTQRQMNIKLWEAVERNDVELIRNLLDKKKNPNTTANPNAAGLNDWTALHMASAYGLKEVCEVLLYNNSDTDINARTSMNRTPLHLATIHNNISVVKLLVHEGALLDLKDNDENTCLHYAATQGYIDILEFFLRKNPDLTIKNLKGRTAADISLNFETFEVFLEYSKKTGSDFPVTGYSRSVVHHTLLHNSREDQINKLLLKSSINPSLNDIKVFEARPKLRTFEKKKKVPNFFKFEFPPCKVGPNDFRGLLQLGKGSFGEVYLVEKKDTLELFALKVLKKEKVLGNNLVRYAFTERNILMTISHPFIIKLIYAFQTPEKLAMIMDFCPNGDLGTQLVRDKRFSEEKARFYLVEVLLALQELHSHGIIFRDLKPDNVVLDKDGHARLTDFGLSKEGLGEEQMTRSFCGSVAYLAPEMLRKSGHTKSVDWYLFGVLVYELLIGSPPYYSSSREQLFNNIQRGKLKIPSNLSTEAKNLIKHLLQRDPSKRLGASKKDAEEVKADPFFKDVDWNAYLNKSVKPPSFHTIRRIYKDVSLEKMFGKLEEDLPAPRLDGWSVLQPS